MDTDCNVGSQTWLNSVVPLTPPLAENGDEVGNEIAHYECDDDEAVACKVDPYQGNGDTLAIRDAEAQDDEEDTLPLCGAEAKDDEADTWPPVRREEADTWPPCNEESDYMEALAIDGEAHSGTAQTEAEAEATSNAEAKAGRSRDRSRGHVAWQERSKIRSRTPKAKRMPKHFVAAKLLPPKPVFIHPNRKATGSRTLVEDPEAPPRGYALVEDPGPPRPPPFAPPGYEHLDPRIGPDGELLDPRGPHIPRYGIIRLVEEPEPAYERNYLSIKDRTRQAWRESKKSWNQGIRPGENQERDTTEDTSIADTTNQLQRYHLKPTPKSPTRPPTSAPPGYEEHHLKPTPKTRATRPPTTLVPTPPTCPPPGYEDQYATCTRGGEGTRKGKGNGGIIAELLQTPVLNNFAPTQTPV